jgi:hypothetical protein
MLKQDRCQYRPDKKSRRNERLSNGQAHILMPEGRKLTMAGSNPPFGQTFCHRPAVQISAIFLVCLSKNDFFSNKTMVYKIVIGFNRKETTPADFFCRTPGEATSRPQDMMP